MHAGPMKVTPSRPHGYYHPPGKTLRPKAIGDLDPRLVWKDPTSPSSDRFDDLYPCGPQGLAAARQVFLAGNQLPQAWRDRDLFVIGETGFGSGLNFLGTWQLWRETAPPSARLHYLSVEGFPLSREQLLHCLAPCSELATLTKQLAEVYPPVHEGFHRVWLDRGRVALTLLVGDAATVLAEAEARVDAWFLDGFAPARNPAMWSPEVFAEIARLSVPQTTFATFTTVETVHRGLENVGFSARAESGFGSRKARLTGNFHGPPQPSRTPPWYAMPVPVSAHGRIAILGAGIAGCAVAEALARRNRPAVLLDRHPSLAAETSGNPSTLVAARPEHGGTDSGDFHDRAYRMALAAIARSGAAWEPCGALRLDTENRGRKSASPNYAANSALWPDAMVRLNSKAASDRAGVALDSPALWIAEAGLVDPVAYATALAGTIETTFSKTAASLTQTDGKWRVTDASGNLIAQAETVVLTAAHATAAFEPASWLPLQPVLGQLSMVPETPTSARLATAVIWGGYVTPAHDGHHILGATHARSGFNPLTWPQPVTHQAHKQNHQALPPPMRSMLMPPETGDWQGRAAVRCATPDHLPAVGPVAREGEFLDAFDHLRHGPRGVFPTDPPYHQGLYVMTGLGSRGIMTAALAAELMVSQMLGEPWPVERRVAFTLSPSRFLVRRLRQPAARQSTES
jgi:tRNA 5-methylaminomethyl-2-thiouridine biosynthesis bifunctional protein